MATSHAREVFEVEWVETGKHYVIANGSILGPNGRHDNYSRSGSQRLCNEMQMMMIVCRVKQKEGMLKSECYLRQKSRLARSARTWK